MNTSPVIVVNPTIVPTPVRKNDGSVILPNPTVRIPTLENPIRDVLIVASVIIAVSISVSLISAMFNDVIPDTIRSSTRSRPSISTSALISISPVNVTTPEILPLVALKKPTVATPMFAFSMSAFPRVTSPPIALKKPTVATPVVLLVIEATPIVAIPMVPLVIEATPVIFALPVAVKSVLLRHHQPKRYVLQRDPLKHIDHSQRFLHQRR